MFPPTSTFNFACFKMWPISAVVVDFPLVPVMPMYFALGLRFCNRSISVQVKTSLAFASTRIGWDAGIPGLCTSVTIADQSISGVLF